MSRRNAGLPVPLRRQWNSTYRETPYRKLPWFSERPYPWIVQTSESGHWAKGTRILDLGCGAGTNSLFLAKAGYEAVGVDIADGAVAAARARAERSDSRATFTVGDVLDLPFPDGHFGGAIDVGCFHTLPVDLRRAYAKEVARVLRPRRTLALSWIAREYRGSLGPPHRPSVEEVTAALEERFLFLRTEYWASYTGRVRTDAPPVYCAWLGRRSFARPAAR